MALYKNIFIATGTVAFVLVMLKLFRSKSRKISKESSSKECDETVNPETEQSIVENVEIVEQQNSDNIVETAETKSKSVKRKIDDIQGIMKFPRPKPNFFIAFQVNDVGIHQKVKRLQEELISKYPALFPAIVNVSTLHITLAVTHLPTEKDIKTVKEKMDEWADRNITKYFKEPCILSFKAIKTFKNVVAYVDIEQGENYKKISDFSKNVNNMLSSTGYTTDKRSFTPHLTFLKLSKDIKLLKSKKYYQNIFESLKECKDHFGNQEVTHIQLLSMDEPKDEFGYYKCLHNIKVSDTVLNMDHSECCIPITNPKKSAKKAVY